MDEIDKKKIKDLMHSLALKYNMRDKDFKNLVESPYEFTNKTIKELDLGEVEEEEDLIEVNTNFVYMGFGKLYIDKKMVIKRVKRDKINLSKKWKK